MINGQDEVSVRGKSTKRHKKRNLSPTLISVPNDVLNNIVTMRIRVDSMCVYGDPFLHSIKKSGSKQMRIYNHDRSVLYY